MVTEKGKYRNAYTYIANLITRLRNKVRMVRQYAPIRNRLLIRNLVLVLAGFLMANGLWIVGLILLIAGLLADEL